MYSLSCLWCFHILIVTYKLPTVLYILLDLFYNICFIKKSIWPLRSEIVYSSLFCANVRVKVALASHIIISN